MGQLEVGGGRPWGPLPASRPLSTQDSPWVGEDWSSALRAANPCLSPRPPTGSGLMGRTLLSPTMKSQALGAVGAAHLLSNLLPCLLPPFKSLLKLGPARFSSLSCHSLATSQNCLASWLWLVLFLCLFTHARPCLSGSFRGYLLQEALSGVPSPTHPSLGPGHFCALIALTPPWCSSLRV